MISTMLLLYFMEWLPPALSGTQLSRRAALGRPAPSPRIALRVRFGRDELTHMEQGGGVGRDCQSYTTAGQLPGVKREECGFLTGVRGGVTGGKQRCAGDRR